MSNIFWRNFHLCFPSSLRCPDNATTTLSPSPPSYSKQDLDLDHHNHDHDHHNHDKSQYSSSLSSSSSHNHTSTSLLIKNFNSLYDFSSEFSTSKDDFLSSTSSSSTVDTDSADTLSPPDLATIFASQRFFFSSPGLSNSIFESPDSSKPIQSTHHHVDQTTPLDGGVAVRKYSPDPYRDFRCSMQEMIEAKNLKDVVSDWDFLHELLFCYLTLNPKHTHKFIISAFSDILISLLSSPDSSTHRKHEDQYRK